MAITNKRLYVVWFNPFLTRVLKMGTVTKGFDARMANRPSLVLTFGHSGTQPCASDTRKSELKEVVG